jgi:hypothetical protein
VMEDLSDGFFLRAINVDLETGCQLLRTVSME